MSKKSIWRLRSDNFISSCFEDSRAKLALDIGCGDNKWKSQDTQTKIIGVDNINYSEVDVVCDVENKLPFKHGEFPLVLMNNFLEHTMHPQKALLQVNRVLSEDGVLVITVPFLVKIHQAPIDFFRYTPFALTKLLNETGFQIDSIKALTSIGDTLLVHIQTFFSIATVNTDNLWKRYLLVLIKKTVVRFIRTLFFFFKSFHHTSNNYTLGYGVKCSKKALL